MKLRLSLLAAASALAFSTPAAAALVIPVGVQNDVLLSDVVGAWGWTEIYRGDYGASADFSTLFAGAGQYVMVAGMRRRSATIDTLAATTLAEALQYTPLNTTHLSNGANWYSNAFSFGFAGAGDSIQQSSADVAGGNERDRLSWHTSYLPAAQQWQQDHTKPAASIFFGYRSGANYLGYDSGWDRVVFTASPSAAGPIPEPSTWALLIAGFGLVGTALRRRRLIPAAA